MIIQAIIDAFHSLAIFVIGLLPDMSTVAAITNFDGFLAVAGYAFWLIPMNIFVATIGICLLVNYWSFFIGGLTWIIRRIPGQG